MAHTKFGVSMSKLCRDTASDVVWHHASNLLRYYTKAVLYITMKSITLCQHSLKMILLDFGENRTCGLGGVDFAT